MAGKVDQGSGTAKSGSSTGDSVTPAALIAGPG
jgi:hypothetical protein